MLIMIFFRMPCSAVFAAHLCVLNTGRRTLARPVSGRAAAMSGVYTGVFSARLLQLCFMIQCNSDIDGFTAMTLADLRTLHAGAIMDNQRKKRFRNHGYCVKIRGCSCKSHGRTFMA